MGKSGTSNVASLSSTTYKGIGEVVCDCSYRSTSCSSLPPFQGTVSTTVLNVLNYGIAIEGLQVAAQGYVMHQWAELHISTTYLLLPPSLIKAVGTAGCNSRTFKSTKYKYQIANK